MLGLVDLNFYNTPCGTKISILVFMKVIISGVSKIIYDLL